MFRNYIKIAFKNLVAHKAFSIINISGLAIGMSAAILIIMWVFDEFSYNNFHENKDDTYLVCHYQPYADQLYPVKVAPPPLASTLKEEVPEIIRSTRYSFWPQQMVVKKEDKIFTESIRFADPDFFEIFTFPLVKGDKKNALNELHSILLSEEMAKKYFGDENPIGKTLNLNNKYEVTVTGVIKEIPDNSSFKFDFVMPFVFMKEFSNDLESWNSNWVGTFVQLQQGSPKELTDKKIFDRLRKARDNDEVTEMFLYPLNNLYLYSLFGAGRIETVKIFIIIAIFILLIACINFMNLATAQSVSRSKEIGMRKTVGASRKQLVKQFLGEAIMQTFISLILAVILVEFFRPVFNELSGKNLVVNYFDIKFILMILVIGLLTGIVAGSYPAFYLSSFSPVKVLKGVMKSGKSAMAFRKVLVVIQFSLSIILIISTILIFKQLTYLKNRKLGYEKENVLYIPVNDNIREKHEIFKKELLKDKDIYNVGMSVSSPINVGSNGGGWEWVGKDPEKDILISFLTAGPDFAKTFNIKMDGGGFMMKILTKIPLEISELSLIKP